MVEQAISGISMGPGDAAGLREVSRLLGGNPTVLVGSNGESAALPELLRALMQEIVVRLADGSSLVVMPEERQFTIPEAADLLELPRTDVIRLLDAGELPCESVGNERLIGLRDVLTYAKRRSGMRRAALDQMARDAWEAGLYDDAGIPEGGQDE